MAKLGRMIAAVLVAACSSAHSEDALSETARLVMAIRYLQVTGTSHSHLYLYSGSGKVLRQLTSAAEGQDRDPVFSPDGKLVVFRRAFKSRNELWSVAPDTGQPKRLTTVPTWYFELLKRPLPTFDFPPFTPVGDPPELRIKDFVGPDDVHYPAPDGSAELLLKLRGDADPHEDFFPKEPWLVEKDKPPVKVSDLPFTAFEGSAPEEENTMRKAGPANEHYDTGKQVGDLDGVMVYQGSPFILAPPLRVAIVRQHRGSTFGEGYFAVDLNTHTLHEIVPTNGDIYVIPGTRGFFCANYERYLPLGDGKRTVNCSFLDLWNAQLQRTRFCAPKVAEFYGACLYQISADQENVGFIPGERELP